MYPPYALSCDLWAYDLLAPCAHDFVTWGRVLLSSTTALLSVLGAGLEKRRVWNQGRADA